PSRGRMAAAFGDRFFGRGVAAVALHRLPDCVAPNTAPGAGPESLFALGLAVAALVRAWDLDCLPADADARHHAGRRVRRKYGDWETRRQGDKETKRGGASSLLVTLSPCLPCLCHS